MFYKYQEDIQNYVLRFFQAAFKEDIPAPQVPPRTASLPLPKLRDHEMLMISQRSSLQVVIHGLLAAEEIPRSREVMPHRMAQK